MHIVLDFETLCVAPTENNTCDRNQQLASLEYYMVYQGIEPIENFISS